MSVSAQPPQPRLSVVAVGSGAGVVEMAVAPAAEGAAAAAGAKSRAPRKTVRTAVALAIRELIMMGLPSDATGGRTVFSAEESRG
jgi:uncharacterized protein (DUF2126 family)